MVHLIKICALKAARDTYLHCTRLKCSDTEHSIKLLLLHHASFLCLQLTEVCHVSDNEHASGFGLRCFHSRQAAARNHKITNLVQKIHGSCFCLPPPPPAPACRTCCPTSWEKRARCLCTHSRMGRVMYIIFLMHRVEKSSLCSLVSHKH